MSSPKFSSNIECNALAHTRTPHSQWEISLISTEYQQSGEQRPRCVWQKSFFFTQNYALHSHSPEMSTTGKMEIGVDLLLSASRVFVCDAVRVCSRLATFPLIRIEIHFEDSDRNAGIEWLPGQFMAINRFSINSNNPSIAFSLCVLHLRCSPKPNSIKFECLNVRENGKRHWRNMHIYSE